MWWCNGSGRIELTLTREQIESGYHSGGCDEDIAELRQEPTIKAQLEALSPDLVARELKEYGFEDLSNHEDNLSRLLWVACGDLFDQPDEDENGQA